MKIFNRFRTQTEGLPIDRDSRGLQMEEQFNLKEPVDEDQLEAFWNHVEEDIQADPEWFKVS